MQYVPLFGIIQARIKAQNGLFVRARMVKMAEKRTGMKKGSEKTVIGVEQANNPRGNLAAIMKSVSEVAEINELIATSTEEQTATANEIDNSISSINILANETANGAKKTSASISDLSNLANNLKNIVEKFKI